MNIIFFKQSRIRILLGVIILGFIFVLKFYNYSEISYSEDEKLLKIPLNIETPKKAKLIIGLNKKTSSQSSNNIDKTPSPLELKDLRERIFGKTNKGADVEKLDFIKNMMLHAWNGYKKNAWGCQEVETNTGNCHNPPILGTKPLGATIVDAMDTLYLMGLDKEVEEARNYIKDLDFDVNSEASVFEINIRYIGSFLSMYSFTKDKIYYEKAEEIAQKLLPAFDTKTGFPKSLINLKTKYSHTHSWSSQGCTILAEFGTLIMEWNYLSEITQNPIYSEKIDKILNSIKTLETLNDGVYYNYYNSETGSPCSKSASFGGLGDSFYEYLIKENYRTKGGFKLGRELYDKAINGLIQTGMYATSERSNSNYISSYEYGSVSKSMEHLTCFAGGMLMLGANGKQENINFQRGLNITSTCRKSYESSAIGLGPEKFFFTHDLDAVSNIQSGKMYILRPEVVESYFYAYRYTRNEKYRNWAWDVVQSIEKNCRDNYGYGGIVDVYESLPKKDNVQQSFFLAETLKYLYLIFASEDMLNLESWVFNTEAHPIPIQ